MIWTRLSLEPPNLGRAGNCAVLFLKEKNEQFHTPGSASLVKDHKQRSRRWPCEIQGIQSVDQTGRTGVNDSARKAR